MNKPICKDCGEDCSYKIVKETMEHWSEQNQCWGENPSVSYYCGNCENEIELD